MSGRGYFGIRRNNGESAAVQQQASADCQCPVLTAAVYTVLSWTTTVQCERYERSYE